MTSISPSDFIQLNPNEDSYDCKEAEAKEVSSYALNSSGRVYSTIMEEPEEDNISVPYGYNPNPLEPICIDDHKNINCNENDNEVTSREVFDSLLTPPPEPDMWRMSGTSCITGVSTTTDCSNDDTLAQDMSELSSINSYLSDLEMYEGNKFGSYKDECDYLANNTPKLSPAGDRKKRRKNVSDAISRLEDIELTAKNLLRENSIHSNAIHNQVGSSHQKRKLHSAEKKRSKDNLNGQIGKVKNSALTKKKSSKSCEQDMEKVPVYWLKSDNMKPYISRESYKEDLLISSDDQIRNSYHERDLNEYLDQLDKVNEYNERNDCLSDENLNTLTLTNSKSSQTKKCKESVKILNKQEVILETSTVPLKKNVTTSKLLENAECDNNNYNSNNCEILPKTENCINKVQHTHNEHNNVKKHDTISDPIISCQHLNKIDEKGSISANLLEDPNGCSKIPVKIKKSPKVKKKGLKSRKTKRIDKSVPTSHNESLDSFCSNINESKCDFLIENQNFVQTNITSSGSSHSMNNSQSVECIEHLTSLDETPMNDYQNSIIVTEIQIASDNICLKKQLIADEIDFNKTIENTQTLLATSNISTNTLKDRKDSTCPGMESTVIQNEENNLIADISNNLWNNHSFDGKDDLFFDHVFSPLPPIQEALSDDYSIPVTPETTSICLNNTNYDNLYFSNLITNNEEIPFMDNQTDTDDIATSKNSENKLVKVISEPENSDTLINIVTDKNNHTTFDLYEYSTSNKEIINNKNIYSMKSNARPNSYVTDETDSALKIDILSQYSDEMMLITEAMEKEIKSEELNNNDPANKAEQSRTVPKREKDKFTINPVNQRPTRSKFEFHSIVEPGSTFVSARENPHFKKKITKHNANSKLPLLVPRKPPFSISPSADSKVVKKCSIPRNKYGDVASGVPFHYKQKRPPFDVNNGRVIRAVIPKGKLSKTLKETSRITDPALAGIDEPSLLDEIQQLLGYGVGQVQNEQTPPPKKDNVPKQTSDVTSTRHIDPPAVTSIQNKTPQPTSIPPRRTPVFDTTNIRNNEASISHQVSTGSRVFCEFPKPSTEIAPPVPPRPQYKRVTERGELERASTVRSLSASKEGVWSPGSAPVDHSGLCSNEHPNLPSFKDVPPVWTPARGGSASPGSGKREYRKISFDGPTVPKRAHQENREIPRPEDSFAWQGKSVQLNNSESLHLPRTLSPTVTILQKKREGLIQDHKAEYLQTDASLASYKQGDKLYTIKKEYESEDEDLGTRKFAVLGPRKVEGVGPVTKEGMPMSLKTGVKSEHQGEWYRRMFDSLHKTKDVRYGGGYMSEPETYDSDAGITRYAKYDRSKNEFEFENPEPAAPRKTKRYVHQPGRIEDYVPGFSSLSERELKANPLADVKLEITTPRPSRQTFQGVRRLGGGYKESGYDSDSTLVFKKREDTRRKVETPRDTSEVYREIQKGGDIPYAGLQRPAPRARASQHNKYDTSEVNIHYRTPIRVERKDFITDEELARRQEEHMQKVYEQERRKKYLSELEDIERRRHTDNFTPLQKSPIPLNRYDDESYGGLRGFKTPEPRQLAKALFGFHAQNKRELNFNKGDILTIRRHIDKNWMEGEFKGNIGIFPSNYVEVLPYDNFKTTPRRPTEGQGRVRFNFQAQTSMEMSLNKGEIIVLIRKVDENWFEGRIATRKGIFPVSYVDVLQEPLGRDVSPIQNTLSRPELPPAHLLFNGTSSVNSPYSTMGHQGNESDNKTSLPPLTLNTQQEPTGHRALYNYKPQNDDELELLEGDVVMVMEKCDDGWFVGTSQRTNLFGTFPGNYVEKI